MRKPFVQPSKTRESGAAAVQGVLSFYGAVYHFMGACDGYAAAAAAVPQAISAGQL
jgi:3-oxoacyl-(acyl-carrier-protein) synthase